MISLKSVKRSALSAVVVMATVAAASCYWADHQLRRFAGTYTKVVDPARFAVPSRLTAITDVDVLSPDGDAMIPRQTVLFDQGRIISVNGGPDFPRDALVIDGNGKYLIPGLIDSHVHLRQSPNDLLLYVATGVTQVREMSGSSQHLQWRSEIERGRLGPRLFVASEKLESWGWLKGPFMRWTRNRINVNAGDDLDALIRSLMNDGYDAVKLGSILDKDQYRGVNRAALKAGIPVIGHLPITAGFEDLWDSGQIELAHIEEVAKALNAEFGYFNSRNADAYLAFVTRRSDEVAARLAAHNVSVTSSLWLIEHIARQKEKKDLDVLLRETRVHYANPGLVEGTRLSKGWLPGNSYYLMSPDADPAELAAAKIYWATFADAHHILLRAMRDKGVHIMAGTDANNALLVPGFSLHDELKSLTEAGLSPAQSLFSATAAPAQWMKVKAGRILPGYRADMVLLRANPLNDIANTKSIEAVIVNGRVLMHSQLDAILDAVLRANDESRTIPLGGA